MAVEFSLLVVVSYALLFIRVCALCADSFIIGQVRCASACACAVPRFLAHICIVSNLLFL